ESGGGAIGVAGLHTDENGRASPGQWTLGPTVGVQTLSATYTGLPKVVFTATATEDDDDEEELVTQTIPTSGGTITVNRPGSPLHGASLELEGGALAGGTSITLVEAATSGLQIPNGMTAVGPALGIVSTAGRMQAGAAVRLPMAPVAGKVMMVAFADPVTRRVTVLPTLRQEAGTITALLPSLSGGSIPGLRQGGGALASVRADEPASLVFMMAIDEELLDQDFDSEYRPGTDDWDFPRMAIADLAFLKRPNEASSPFAAADDGMVTTSLWYYVNRRKQGGPPLHGSTQLFAQQPLSSRYGIRWAALAERDVPPINQTGGLLIREWGEWGTEDLGRFQWLQFQGIKALLLTTFNRPVPVVLIATDNLDELNAESHPLAIAYRTVGNTLYLAWHGSPGSEIAVQFSEQGMTPFALPNQNGTANMVRAIGGIHYVNVINDSKLAAQWAGVANETIGNAEGWPTPKLHWEKAELDTARVYLLDELQHWWECSQCPDKVPTPSHLPATASHVQRFRSVTMGDGTGFPDLSASFASASLSADDTFEEEERLDRKGFVINHPVETDPMVGTAAGWLDWLTVAYRKLELEPSVESIEFGQDTTVTIAVTPSETPPAGTRYRWLLRTEDSQDSVETTTPTHTRDLEAGTDGWLVFSALEGEHKRPIARDSIRITGDNPAPYWRFLTAVDTDEFFDGDTEGGSDEFDMLVRMITVPGAAMISIENDVLQLRVRKSGVWPSEVPGPYNAANEWRMILGPASPQNHALGPFFAGWGTSSWSQTTADLDAGSITSQTILGTTSYQVKDAGTQTGPLGGVRSTATRDGTAMTGEISIWIWWIDGESGEVEEPADGYRFSFTAVRVQ
ncbi:MAG TPA: hypothetical protein PLL69_03190, partial [Gemmatimonadales bacterium]|nr:hypothetical protein [Gemmatimonadales bacterium]